jgi:hypothetical protein
MVRAAGTRVGTDDVEKLARLVAIHQVVESAIFEAVRGLRAAGHTWQDIGDVTGTTRQAALMKWSKLV